MDDNLREVSELLREGQKRSWQPSYRRRAPANAAIPYLRQARNGLRLIVEAQPGNAEAWQLLSQAEETLLGYRNTRIPLERVIALESRPNATSRSSPCCASMKLGGTVSASRPSSYPSSNAILRRCFPPRHVITPCVIPGCGSIVAAFSTRIASGRRLSIVAGIVIVRSCTMLRDDERGRWPGTVDRRGLAILDRQQAGSMLCGLVHRTTSRLERFDELDAERWPIRCVRRFRDGALKAYSYASPDWRHQWRKCRSRRSKRSMRTPILPSRRFRKPSSRLFGRGATPGMTG